MTPLEFGVSRSKVKVTVLYKLTGHTCFINISCWLLNLQYWKNDKFWWTLQNGENKMEKKIFNANVVNLIQYYIQIIDLGYFNDLFFPFKITKHLYFHMLWDLHIYYIQNLTGCLNIAAQQYQCFKFLLSILRWL